MKKRIVILIPIIVIIGYILYKGCLLLYFRDLNNYSVDYENITIKEKKIKVDKTLANTKKENINIYVPDELIEERSESGYYVYVPRNETGKLHTTYMTITKGVSCYEAYVDENKRIQTIGYEKLMKKNNMKSDMDLVKYYYTQAGKKNIFTSSNDIKLHYLSEMCAKNSTINGNGNRNYYFSGDLDGTLYIEDNRESRIKIYNEDKDEYYWIYTHIHPNKKEYVEIITEEVFNKILHSIYFD